MTVGNDMTAHSRIGLIDNIITMVFAHPVQRLAAEAIHHMQADLANAAAPGKRLLGFDIFGPENL
ncbi:hypothetical protein ACFSHQ_25080 [Gemmobacter lanyuensis]